MAGQRQNWPGPGYAASASGSSPGNNSSYGDAGFKGAAFQGSPQGQAGGPVMMGVPGGSGAIRGGQPPQPYQATGLPSPQQPVQGQWPGATPQQYQQRTSPQGHNVPLDPVALAGGPRAPGAGMPGQYAMYGPQGAQLPQQPVGVAPGQPSPVGMGFPGVGQYGYQAPGVANANPATAGGSQWISSVPTATSNQPLRAAPPQAQAHIQAQILQQQRQQQLQQAGQPQGGQQRQPPTPTFAGFPGQQMMTQPGMPRSADPYQQAYQQMYKNDDADEDGDDGDDDNEDGKKGKAQKGASEFVKKLFRMLDDTSYSPIVSWSPAGDSFIVRDMNDFTKHVLPRHFRHSNFASFVRQLNKYDFHKVKKPDEHGQPQQPGVDQQWEFRHPAFLRGREDLLDSVRRKVPATKKSNRREDGSSRDGSPSMPALHEAAERGAHDYAMLKEQVATLTQSQDQMTNHINNLTKQYQAVIGEMLTFQKNMVQQDQLMQNLIQYLMSLEADRSIDGQRATTQQSQRQTPQIEAQHQASAGPSSSQQQTSAHPHVNGSGAFVSAGDADKLVTNFNDLAKESFAQMSNLAQRANSNGSSDGAANTAQQNTAPQIRTTGTSMSTSVNTPLSPRSSRAETPGGSKRDSHDQQHSIFLHPPHLEADEPSNELFNAAASAVDNPSLAGFEGAGLRVFTVGTLQPREGTDAGDPSLLQGALGDIINGTGSNESTPFGMNVPHLERLPDKMPKVDLRTSSAATPGPPDGDGSGAQRESSVVSEGGSNMLRVRRSTYVPGWAVPPKVLVVDDDDVCRKLGSKFLQVFGCAIDVAVDGVTAVNKMNLEKYDLVLMDIVMPNLDGVSATSLIREFDARTPIISMTSNSAPSELMSYMKSGMNDVLPKPFTKEGLLTMLEKHLIHLKTVQKMDEIPRALGLPPVSDAMMQNVLSATAASAQSTGAGTSAGPGLGANPMAAMMGNGPEMLRASQEAIERRRSAGNSGADDNGFGVFDGFSDLGANPLAGMGFSDEEYISMLQNLIAAGSISDAASRTNNESSDLVAGVMGVSRGDGSAPGARSKENTPMFAPRSSNGGMPPPAEASGARSAGTTRKRPSGGDAEAVDAKRSRFTELPT